MHVLPPYRTCRALLPLAGALLLAGCWSVGRDYQVPALATPTEYAEPTPPGQLPLEGWWASLGDSQLVGLVARGLERNRDLRLAFARLAEVRAEVGMVDAGFGPTIGAAAGVQRTGLSRYTYIPFRIPPFTEYQAGFDASWELDIWGAVRREREGALASVDAGAWNTADVANTVSAEIVRTWLDLRLANARMVVAQASLLAARLDQRIHEDRLQAGLATISMVATARGAVHRAEAAIAPLQAQVSSDLHALGTLLAEDPASLGLPDADGRLPSLTLMLQVGVPADLLRRRPDVRAAERQLAAATAQVGVAEADLYPRLSLNGNFGLDSIDRTRLLTRGALTWGFGPALSWNIIDWGKVHAQMRVADRRVDQAFLGYEQAVLRAEQEVADALSGIAHDQDEIAALSDEFADSSRQEALEQELQEHGLSEASAVTSREISRFQVADALLLAHAHQLQQVVALAKALGGGWDVARAPAAHATPANPPPRARCRKDHAMSTDGATPSSPGAPPGRAARPLPRRSWRQRPRLRHRHAPLRDRAAAADAASPSS